MATVDPLDLYRWPMKFTASSEYWGPIHEEACPCGSGRRASDCHVDPTAGRWLTPTYEPLLTDTPTGFAHPSCYASVARDCSAIMSKEHWLSAAVLREAGDNKPLRVSGMPWQAGQEHRLGEASLSAKVLCQRHNSALSRLDRQVGRAFATLRHYQQDLPQQPDPHGHEFALYSGEELERWVLKLLWGGCAAKAFGHRGATVDRLRSDADQSMLADYLFRDGSLPDGWGLYLEGQPGAEIRAEAEIALDTQVGPDGGLWAGSVEFGVIRISFALGVVDERPGSELVPRPQGVFLSDSHRRDQKIFALGWDRESSHPVMLTFLRSEAETR